MFQASAARLFHHALFLRLESAVTGVSCGHASLQVPVLLHHVLSHVTQLSQLGIQLSVLPLDPLVPALPETLLLDQLSIDLENLDDLLRLPFYDILAGLVALVLLPSGLQLADLRLVLGDDLLVLTLLRVELLDQALLIVNVHLVLLLLFYLLE